MDADLKIEAIVNHKPSLLEDSFFEIPILITNVDYLNPLESTHDNDRLKERTLVVREFKVLTDRDISIKREDRVIIYGNKNDDFPSAGYNVIQVDVLRKDDSVSSSYFFRKNRGLGF